ncbi:hypothetical protein KAR53_07460 [Periweissella ghanensis]|nr:hypothetical protein [Periweissella ghanensis]
MFNAVIDQVTERIMAKVDKLTDRLERLTSRIDVLGSVTTRVDELESDTTELKTTIAVHEERLNKLEDK